MSNLNPKPQGREEKVQEQKLPEGESQGSEKQELTEWKPYELDYRAQKIVLQYRDQKDVLNESHKMRMTVAYGLERFWGEHLRLKKDNKTKQKSAYWESVWIELANILEQANVELPHGSIAHDDTKKIEETVKQIWNMNLDERRVALMILTQFCDSLVWWTQRYKKKNDNDQGESNS